MDNELQIEVERLLAGVPAVHNSCDLDLLVFLHRHPRTLLTNEQLAKFAGYNIEQIAKAIDTFVAAGLVEPTVQSPTHAARMYVLVLDGPFGERLRKLLEFASTRLGRGRILEALDRQLAVGSAGAGGEHHTKSSQPNILELRRAKRA